MRNFFPSFLFIGLLFAACGDYPSSQNNSSVTLGHMPQISIEYPQTDQVDQQDDYHGTLVKDAYRWLENEDSVATQEWVKSQNKVTFSYLDQIPFRESIRQRLEDLWNYPKFSAPFKGGGKYYYFKNDGLQNQSVLYSIDHLEDEGQVFLDPNQFSEDGTSSLTTFSVSDDGKYAVYGVSKGGSDWNEFFVREVATGKDLSDHLKWIKFSGAAWHGNGFYYGRFAAPEDGRELSSQNENKQIYYHAIGTDQSADQLIYEDPAHPQRGIYTNTSDDERLLLLYLSEGATTNNALKVKDLSKPNSPFVTLVDRFDASYDFIDNLGSSILLMTTDGAPRKRVVKVDLEHPEKENWVELIPEQEEVLQGVSLVGGKLFAKYLKDASSHVFVYDLEGNLSGEVNLPGIGTVTGFNGKQEDEIAFYVFSSFTYPPTIFKYDIASNTSSAYSSISLEVGFPAPCPAFVSIRIKTGSSPP